MLGMLCNREALVGAPGTLPRPVPIGAFDNIDPVDKVPAPVELQTAPRLDDGDIDELEFEDDEDDGGDAPLWGITVGLPLLGFDGGERLGTLPPLDA